MPKFEINATELTDTDINFVALVKRGANRIPFRITKGDDDMIDLAKIGQRIFKTEAQPVVVAAFVEKGADLPAAVKTLKSVGIDVATFVKSEKEGRTAFVQKADAPPKDVMLLKMAGGVSLAFDNLTKSFDGYDFQSPDFGEVHAKGSHMASMSSAADSLHRTLGNIMDTATDPKDCANKMSAACDAHKAHIATLTKKLPTAAFKADQELLKAEVALIKAGGVGRHPNGGVAMAIAHAAHQAAITAGQAADMLASGSGGGSETDQQTGPLPGQNNGMKKAEDGKNLGIGDRDAEDPLMPPANPGQTKTISAQKADAGKNGTGAGVELGEGTGDDARSTADDQANTEVNAKPGGKTSGSDSGMPAMAKAPTKKTAVLAAQLAVAQATLALAKAEEEMDDDSTNGAQSDLPPKAKSRTTKEAHTTDVTTEKVTGEGDEASIFVPGGTADNDRAEAAGSADDNKNSGGNVTGKVKGKTLDTAGIPARAMSSTTKNDGDAAILDKNKSKDMDESMSGSGAQEANAQTLKSGDAIMKAVQALSKTVSDSLAGVTKSIGDINARVDQVSKLAQKNDAALSGTVLGEAGGDNVRTMKSASSGAPPLLDTAYSRRTA